MSQASKFKTTVGSWFLGLLVVMCAGVSAEAQPWAFVGNNGSGTVSVINTTASPPTVVATVAVGTFPNGVSISPDGMRAYVANHGSNTVSVIDTTTAPPSVLATVPGLNGPYGIAVHPNGMLAYVVNTSGSTVSVIDTDSTSPTFNTVVATVSLTGSTGSPWPGLAISPDGTRAYVAVSGSNTVAVIDADSASPTFNTVVTSITVGNLPRGIAFSSDGNRAYVTNSNNVSVIDTDPASP